jgi:hypothetical protein
MCRTRQPVLVLAALLGAPCVGAAALVAAQPASPAAGQPVALSYRFQPGHVSRHQMKMEADLKLIVPGQGGIAGQEVPAKINTTMVGTRKVAEVTPAGEGVLSVTLDTAEMNASAIGLNIVVRGSNGKLTATLNDQALPAENLGPLLMGIDQVFGKSFSLRMAPSGQLVDLKAGAEGALGPLSGLGLQQMFSGVVVLPDHPVNPGDSWETKTSVALPARGGKPVEVRTQTSNTLKSLAMKGGHQIATIETKGKPALAGEGAPDPAKFKLSFTTTSHFDVTEGQSLDAVMLWDVAMDTEAIQGPPGDTPPVVTLPGTSLTGKMKLVIGPAPPPGKPAKPGRKAERRSQTSSPPGSHSFSRVISLRAKALS